MKDPTTEGYSGIPLARKLGIKPGGRIAFVHAPAGFTDLLSPIPQGVEIQAEPSAAMDLVVLFVDRLSTLQADFANLAKCLKPAGMIWVAWPKKSSRVPTDLNENRVRDYGLEGGLVDVKVCAIDPVWSGLKFVVRVRDRQKKGRTGPKIDPTQPLAAS